ncbi:MAG: serine dehydratase subunit alpha family protein [Negativicutes bacterium]|nr:serine dehydratase subunit alpha family protein [Negativicutes bacterium]
MNEYVKLLRQELVPAFGCTEPIALAFAAAKTVEVLGELPDTICAKCSGNIVKNVKSVVIPNSGGKKGIEYAVLLGAIVGDSSKELEILEAVTDADRTQAEEMYQAGACTVELVPDVENLYIELEARKGAKVARVIVENAHTNISCIEKNGEIIFAAASQESSESTKTGEEIALNFDAIYEFANTVNIDDVQDVMEMQIAYNRHIAEEGLQNQYGSNIGKLFQNEQGGFDTVEQKAKAYAAAASDARMSGCAKPVVINAGSGNQGLTVSMPVIVYAEHYHKTPEELYRALVFANLIGIYIKKGIGRLSAYCGVVSAAAASIAGVAFLLRESKEVVEDTLSNALATLSGTICDGAKASCALKIAASLGTALLAYKQARLNNSFKAGDGVVKGSIDGTIRAICEIGKNGMKETDVVILNTMMEN